MRMGRVVALMIGCLLLVPGLGLLVGGVGPGAAYAIDRDDSGYLSETVDQVQSPTGVIATQDLDPLIEPGSPDWLLDRLTRTLKARFAQRREAPPHAGSARQVSWAATARPAAQPGARPFGGGRMVRRS